VEWVNSDGPAGLEVYTRRACLLEAISDLPKFPPSRLGYDILSISPTSHPTFSSACTTPNIDIITLNDGVNRKSPSFRLNRPDLKEAADRGIVFEVVYRSGFEGFNDNSGDAANESHVELRNLIST